MANLDDHAARPQRFLLVVALLIFFGGWHSTEAQGPVPGTGFSRTNKANDPEVPKYLARSSNRSTKSPSDAKNQQAFKDAIESGNKARKSFDYEKAFASYRRATELYPNDASGYYGLGNVYYDLACNDSAIDFYSRAVERKPDYVEALVQLGYSYVSKERYDEAGIQFDAALNLKRKNIDARLGQLYVQAKKGKYQESIDGINQLINDKLIQDKDRASANMALGSVLDAQQRWGESIVPYRKAIQLDPNLSYAYITLGTSQMVSAFSGAQSSAVDATQQDREKLSASAREAAENMRVAIYQKHYDHPIGYLLLGMALRYQSDYQNSLKRIDDYLVKVKELETRLSALDSTLKHKCDYAFGQLYASGYLQQGSTYERWAEETGANKDELLREAIKQLKRAIETKQNFAIAYHALGNIYFRQKKYREAIDELKKGLIHETTDFMKASSYGLIGSAYVEIGPASEAIDYLNKAINLDPQNSSNYGPLAQVYKAQGNFDEAIRLLKKSMEFDRKPSASSYYLLASAYFFKARKTGNDADDEEAIKLLEHAISINPSFAQAYLALGNSYKFYKNGVHADKALANYEKAKDYNPNDPSIYFLIGDLHASVTQNYDAAIKYLSEAIKLKPDYWMAYWTLAIVYRGRKDDSEAIKLFLEGLKYRKDMNAYILLADSYDRQKNYDDATKWLLEAVRLEPENHSPYLALARVNTHQRKNDEAIGYYEQATSRLKLDDLANKNLYVCRIMRLRRQYSDALDCFQKLNYPRPDQVPYEIGVTHLESGNRAAALAQHQQLVKLKSPLAEELLRQINEMK